MYELWSGTPNEMSRQATGALGVCVDRAKAIAKPLRTAASKFDRAGDAQLGSMLEEMRALTPGTVGELRSWQFPLSWVEFKMEIRRTDVTQQR
jgi:hypothetical protein